jgi:CBS domain-containing protein
MMNTVKEMLNVKGRNIWSIGATETVYRAIEMMAERDVNALTVKTNDSQLAGIISERDYARKVILRDQSSRDTKVADIMTTEVIFVTEETSFDSCISLMGKYHVRHLPVMNGKTPVGMITVGDLLKFIIKKQSIEIEELESYIFEDRGGES